MTVVVGLLAVLLVGAVGAAVLFWAQLRQRQDGETQLAVELQALKT